MSDRVTLVTGATSGIGRATAVALAKSGHEVIAVGRDEARGEEVAATMSDAGRFLRADLSSIAEINRLADAVRQDHDRLDLLINNAGVTLRRKQLSADGIEASFAINTLAPFLLTHRLLDLLASGGGRVVNIATEVPPRTRLELDDLVDPLRYTAFTAYSRSKLALLMVTIEQAARYADRGVSVVALHPGVVFDTRLSDEMPRWLMWLGPLAARLMGRRTTSSADAATDILAIATARVDPGHLYGEGGRQMEPPPAAHESQLRSELWGLLQQLSGVG